MKTTNKQPFSAGDLAELVFATKRGAEFKNVQILSVARALDGQGWSFSYDHDGRTGAACIRRGGNVSVARVIGAAA